MNIQRIDSNKTDHKTVVVMNTDLEKKVIDLQIMCRALQARISRLENNFQRVTNEKVW